MNRKSISEPSHSLDRERGFVSVLVGKRTGQVNNIDWQTLLAGKKTVPEREPADVGVEAPRNSLESSPGTRTPRFSGVRRDDIPYGVEIPKPAIVHCKTGEFGKKPTSGVEVLPIKTLIAQDSSDAEHDKKRRSAPSVVARLMGLDAIPEKLSKGSPLKPPKPSHGSKKDAKLHSVKADSSGSKPPNPLLDVDTIKDFPLPRDRARTDADEERAKVDILPFRAHPQERQLQEFKKEFMEQLALNQRCGPPAVPSAAAAATSAPVDTDFRVNRKLLREKLSEAKVALVRGVDHTGKLSTAQERLLETKEFQEAIELLQSNKEFFRKFFPEANSESFGSNNKDPPEPESTSRRSFHLEDLMCREPVRYDDASRRSFHGGDFTRDWRKTSLMEDPSKGSSRRSFHLDELSRDSRKSFHHPHESPKDNSGRRSFHIEYSSSRDSRRSPHYMDDVAKEIRALEDFPDSRHGEFLADSRGHSSSETVKRRDLRHRGSAGASPLAEKAVMFSKPSPKVSMSTRDSPVWASPDNAVGRHGSPNNFESRKTCDSPSRIVVLKPGPGEITLLTPSENPGCSPNSYRLVRDSQGSVFEAREVLLLDPKERCSPPRKEGPRLPKERFSPPRKEETRYHPRSDYKERFSPPRNEEPRYPVAREDYRERFSPPRKEEPRFSKDEYRDPRLDPRAIARDIVREARTNSTRELSRDRETGRDSPKHERSHRSTGSTGGKKFYLPKYGHGAMESGEEIMPAADESLGSFTLAALSRRHAIEERTRSMSPTVPRPSPRSPSRDQSPPSDKISNREGRAARSSEKPRAVYHVEHLEEQQYKKGLTEARRTYGEAQERTRPPMTSRRGKFLPGTKATYSRGSADDWHGPDVNLYSPYPGVDKIVKSESMYMANQHPNGVEESQEKSPRTMLWSRSIPSVVPMAKSRNGDEPSRSRGAHLIVPESNDNSGLTDLNDKTAEARPALLNSKKAITGSDPSTFGRSGHHQVRSFDQSGGAVQDVHVDDSRAAASPAPSAYVSLPSRSSLKKTISTECVPKRGARACDHDVVDALTQRPRQATPATMNDSDAEIDRSEAPTGPKGKLPNQERFEVSSDKKQGGKDSKEWSIATGPLENGDGDGASETSVDKCGQPSPVSVLDSPFEAEIASPKELKELSSDIQDLRLRLRLLKLDGSEKGLALLDSSSARDKQIVQEGLVRHTENSVESTDSTGSSITSATFSIYKDLESQSQGLCIQTDELDVKGLSCPEGRQEELIYVRNVLVASGFTEGSTAMIGRWHSPSCALDPALYERLEDYYIDADLQVALGHGNVNSNGHQDSFQRRLLFDVVNEVLLQLLGPYMRYQPWVRTTKPPLRPMPSNQQLLGAIWSKVCRLFSPRGVQDFEALDYIMGQDVSKDSPWIESQTFFEQIGLELEKSIFDSLIEDAVHSFASGRNYLLEKSVEFGRLIYV